MNFRPVLNFQEFYWWINGDFRQEEYSSAAMEYHHDSALQMNLCLKELELENLLFHRDPQQGR